jgi:putative toxin-antitoxin system antitoxin component (TIGR02293 family)
MSYSLFADVGLRNEIYEDQFMFLNAITVGISGSVVESTVNLLPEQRGVICRALGTTSRNLHSLFRRETLNKQQSEIMLDILSVYNAAYELYDDMRTARELLNTQNPALNNQKPSDLLDTFMGRSLVKEVLNKMAWAEFS